MRKKDVDIAWPSGNDYRALVTLHGVLTEFGILEEFVNFADDFVDYSDPKANAMQILRVVQSMVSTIAATLRGYAPKSDIAGLLLELVKFALPVEAYEEQRIVPWLFEKPNPDLVNILLTPMGASKTFKLAAVNKRWS